MRLGRHEPLEFDVIAEGLGFPEAPVIARDGGVLAVDIDRGTVVRAAGGRVEVVATPGGGPNGMAIGPDGLAYIANNGGFRSRRRHARREEADVYPVPGDVTTNIAFGGSDRRRAVITLSRSGRLVETTWPRPGLALHQA